MKKFAEIEVFYENVNFFGLEMFSKTMFCSKIAQKGKTCLRLLIEHNWDRPGREKYKGAAVLENYCVIVAGIRHVTRELNLCTGISELCSCFRSLM